MGLFTLLLVVIVILAIIGLGWKSVSSGVIIGFETDVGQPVIKNLTQEVRNYVNNSNMIVPYSFILYTTALLTI